MVLLADTNNHINVKTIMLWDEFMSYWLEAPNVTIVTMNSSSDKKVVI